MGGCRTAKPGRAAVRKKGETKEKRGRHEGKKGNNEQRRGKDASSGTQSGKEGRYGIERGGRRGLCQGKKKTRNQKKKGDYLQRWKTKRKGFAVTSVVKERKGTTRPCV